ncbi:MAG TPA: L,D-transpeptidase [Caldilineaceae bacterium]|nr:L,D-transpeptidase [Caldilineaceae bacterium]
MRFVVMMVVGLTIWATTVAAVHAAPKQILESNGLTISTTGALQGVVEVSGIAQHPTFRKWQLDLQLAGDPAQTTFLTVSEQAQPTLGVLTMLDTTRFPNGQHRLRLRVVHSNLNYDEYFTTITIDNPNSPIAASPTTTGEGLQQSLLVPATPLGQGIPEGERRIEVDLSEQTLTAWQGDTVVMHTAVSTGRAEYPTVVGTWPIRVKLTSTRMIGPGYDTPDVPWTMYFFRGYAVHGAYWHNNFGTPVSHGCINMRPAEAELLFHWASVGTNVTVQE